VAAAQNVRQRVGGFHLHTVACICEWLLCPSGALLAFWASQCWLYNTCVRLTRWMRCHPAVLRHLLSLMQLDIRCIPRPHEPGTAVRRPLHTAGSDGIQPSPVSRHAAADAHTPEQHSCTHSCGRGGLCRPEHPTQRGAHDGAAPQLHSRTTSTHNADESHAHTHCQLASKVRRHTCGLRGACRCKRSLHTHAQQTPHAQLGRRRATDGKVNTATATVQARPQLTHKPAVLRAACTSSG
jgi:hypothetical protein